MCSRKALAAYRYRSGSSKVAFAQLCGKATTFLRNIPSPCWDEDDFAHEDYENPDLHDTTYDIKPANQYHLERVRESMSNQMFHTTVPSKYSDNATNYDYKGFSVDGTTGFVEYNVEIPSAGALFLKLTHFTADKRPMRVFVNDALVGVSSGSKVIASEVQIGAASTMRQSNISTTRTLP